VDIVTERFSVPTKGEADIVNITDHVASGISKHELTAGTVTIFVSGSTAGITTTEYEPGLKKDIPAAFERIAPRSAPYHHDDTWHDGNGHAHVRAALLGPSLTVPFHNGKLALGTWQQIVLIDFDNRPRTRQITLQIIGK
jgi:secondary thiamine-phosphate synthase enzyme